MICGYGPGISDAVARRFGREGYRVALVARNADRLADGVKKLEASGVKATAFARDLGKVDQVAALVHDVREALGSLHVIHWNAYTPGAGDLVSAPSELHGVLDVTVHGLLAAVQAGLADLKANHGALLVTGGGFAYYDAEVDKMATQWGAMGLAVGKAAQHKVVGLLRERLKLEEVYVGEVVVTGLVKGTAFDQGNATLDASDIADKFWEVLERREPSPVTV